MIFSHGFPILLKLLLKRSNKTPFNRYYAFFTGSGNTAGYSSGSLFQANVEPSHPHESAVNGWNVI